MGDLEGLLRSCLARPADAAPRLVLADWLEERGRMDMGTCPLRLPGYWWLVPDQTRLQVASVAYWRAPKADRILTRLGSVADLREPCLAGFRSHSDARTWMGQKVGWACGAHALAGKGDLAGVGNAVLRAEETFVGNRSARGRFKKQMAEG